jgi:hypothetical protein
MIFTNDIIDELVGRLENELSKIIEELGIPEITSIYKGYFEPITKSNVPALFVVQNEATKVQDDDDETYSSYWVSLNVSLFPVCRASADATLASNLLEKYNQAIVIFINNHYQEYDWESIESYMQLGADSSKRWSEIKMKIKFEIKEI